MQGNMSDEFKLPLHWPDDGTVGSVLDADLNMQFQSQEQLNFTAKERIMKRQSMARAAAHAINCHDDLVDALQGLMDWQVKNVNVWNHPTWDYAHRVITKARGGR